MRHTRKLAGGILYAFSGAFLLWAVNPPVEPDEEVVSEKVAATVAGFSALQAASTVALLLTSRKKRKALPAATLLMLSHMYGVLDVYKLVGVKDQASKEVERGQAACWGVSNSILTTSLIRA